MPDDVEITVTERGFQRYDGPWQDVNRNTVRVYESSAAREPCCWVRCESFDHTDVVGLHLNIEQVEKLRRELGTFVEQAKGRWTEPAVEGEL